MKKRLLIPIDLSPYGSMLLRTASVWAQRTGAAIVLIHRVSGKVPTLTDSNLRSELLALQRSEAQNLLHEMLDAAGIPDHVPVTLKVSNRDVLHTLNELHGHDGHSDLVMVGIKGTGIMKKILLGSTATRIVEGLNRPVVALPLRTAFFPEGIMVGVHHGTPFNVSGLHEVVRWFEGEVRVSRVFSVVPMDEVHTDSSTYVEELARQTGGPAVLVGGEDVLESINLLMQGHHTSLLALQRGSRAMTDRVFRDFLTNDLMHEGLVPLLVIP